MQGNKLSITGKIWEIQSQANKVQLSQKIGVSEIIGRVLTARQPDINSEEAFQFLSPQFSHMPDPEHLLDIGKAVARIRQSLVEQEKIAIWGDYDVDGACASALLIRYFKALGVEPVLYIPDRLNEGYGPNTEGMQKLKEQGVSLVITVDCGSTAVEALELAQQIGLDVVVTDHHQCLPALPPAVAIVNPNRVDETSSCTMLCGAGVAFYLLMALNRTLRKEGFFTEKQLKEPDLRQWLDLVATASICDLVPLVGVNRVLVQRGLQVLNQRQNAGLNALAEVSNATGELGAYHLGFQIGPRLNAGGRLADSDLGAKLLSTDSESEATQLAQRLDRLNQERRKVQEKVQEEATEIAEKQAQEPAIIVAGEGWHPGVVGIVAARLKEKFHRPTFVLSMGEDGTSTGSGRSISRVDLGQAVQACHKHILRGGGHAMAAGVTLENSKIKDFSDCLRQCVMQQVARVADPFTPHINIDGILQPATITEKFMQEMERLQPFGSGHAEPTFALSGVTLRDYRPVGADGKHAKLRLSGADGTSLDAIAFGVTGTPLGDFLYSQRGQRVSLAGNIRENSFNGRKKADFHVKDAFAGIWEPKN
ncbi:MAG: single-stranded-DNA-specific exonuclease RecJ [Alphaproteobacteria bacterium]|nr:single-stranded-DNA-specific exonuclease RecJ [Alphaproteobacteria bacterium]